MTIIVSIDVIKKTICSPAGEELVRYAEERGLTELSFDETIAHWKALGKRGWAVWLYKNKAMFEKLANQQATPEEEATYSADLQYLEQQIEAYQVNGIVYKTIEEAEAARQKELDLLKPEAEALVVCSFELINENGDSTWVNVDLDDFVAPTDTQYKIKVFNPVHGIYDDCDSLEQALIKRNENMVLVSDHTFGKSAIKTVFVHPNFINDTSA